MGIRELLDDLAQGELEPEIEVESLGADHDQSFDVLLLGDSSYFVQLHILELLPLSMVSVLVEIYLDRIDR